MHVRKFEADTLDEALKAIKNELGPDAIILKTVTNKGLKGAFKKKKIEITAAISEKNYEKKAQVDHAIGPQKDKFYQNPASSIAKSIDEYNEHKNVSKSYGGLGLNRTVSKKQDDRPRSPGLDAFLSEDEIVAKAEVKLPVKKMPEEVQSRPSEAPVQTTMAPVESRRIDELEKKIFDLQKIIEKMQEQGPAGLIQLRTTLRTLDISESYIQKIIKKVTFELERNQLDDTELVFENCLEEMMKDLNIARPKFSSLDDGEENIVTVIISDGEVGQTTMCHKLAALKGESVLIKTGLNETGKKNFTEKMLELKSVEVKNIPEIVMECRKSMENGHDVFVDFKRLNREKNEVKNFIEGLRRSFKNVEVLLCINAIHCDLHNRKAAKEHRDLIDGIVITHLDQCLNYGALFNLNVELEKVPYVFFGTGKVVPEDLEAASAERILSGMFKLN